MAINQQELLEALQSFFPQYLKQEFGVEAAQLNDHLAAIDTLYAQQMESRIDGIIGLQGQELEDAKKAIQDYYEKLPAGQQKALDNETGVELIWQRVKGTLEVDSDSTMVQGVAPTDVEQQDETSPGYQWNSAAVMAKMAEPDYEEKWRPAIEQAYQENRVSE